MAKSASNPKIPVCVRFIPSALPPPCPPITAMAPASPAARKKPPNCTNNCTKLLRSESQNPSVRQIHSLRFTTALPANHRDGPRLARRPEKTAQLHEQLHKTLEIGIPKSQCASDSFPPLYHRLARQSPRWPPPCPPPGKNRPTARTTAQNS